MSLYNDASLLLIPSGYKSGTVYSQIPTDGSGDLTFTRASDATRVNSEGLIEKVRTNLLTYSEEFDDAAWVKQTDTTISSNATTSPDGYTNADKLINSTSVNRQAIYQNSSLTNVVSFSVFAKKAEYDVIQLTDGRLPTFFANFDLTNGVLGSVVGYTASIQDYGNGWYRCAVTADYGTFTINQPRISIAQTTTQGRLIEFAGSGTDGVFIYGAQVETGDIATEYIPTTSAAVSVGMTANVPRLDYTNSSCPSLLLEPQRTNLVTYSEQFDNGDWNKQNSSITSNNATSPDGYVSADKLVENTSNSTHRIFNNSAVTVSSTNPTTYSVFLKAAGRTRAFVRDNDIVGAEFNLSTGTIVATEGTATATITNYGNGWYRCTITRVSSTTSGRITVYMSNGTSDTYTGDGTSGVLIYGAQLEAGSYATSYIPTLGTSVTRVADECYKTGISSLIGQSEGTIFLDFVVSGVGANSINIYNNDRSANSISTNAVVFQPNGLIECQTFFGNGTFGRVTLLATGNSVGQRIKLGFRYKSGDFAVYVNGVQKSTDTTTMTFIGTKNTIELDNNNVYYNYQEAVLYNQFVQFPTALTNTELAAITTL